MLRAIGPKCLATYSVEKRTNSFKLFLCVTLKNDESLFKNQIRFVLLFLIRRGFLVPLTNVLFRCVPFTLLPDVKKPPPPLPGSPSLHRPRARAVATGQRRPAGLQPYDPWPPPEQYMALSAAGKHPARLQEPYTRVSHTDKWPFPIGIFLNEGNLK